MRLQLGQCGSLLSVYLFSRLLVDRCIHNISRRCKLHVGWNFSLATPSHPSCRRAPNERSRCTVSFEGQCFSKGFVANVLAFAMSGTRANSISKASIPSICALFSLLNDVRTPSIAPLDESTKGGDMIGNLKNRGIWCDGRRLQPSRTHIITPHFAVN